MPCAARSSTSAKALTIAIKPVLPDLAAATEKMRWGSAPLDFQSPLFNLGGRIMQLGATVRLIERLERAPLTKSWKLRLWTSQPNCPNDRHGSDPAEQSRNHLRPIRLGRSTRRENRQRRARAQERQAPAVARRSWRSPKRGKSSPALGWPISRSKSLEKSLSPASRT